MPFKTGMGTAGIPVKWREQRSAMFQCPLRRAWVLRGTPSEVLDFQGVARGVSLTSVIGGVWRVGKGIFSGSFFEVSVGNWGVTNLTCLNDISRGGWGASPKFTIFRRVCCSLAPLAGWICHWRSGAVYVKVAADVIFRASSAGRDGFPVRFGVGCRA